MSGGLWRFFRDPELRRVWRQAEQDRAAAIAEAAELQAKYDAWAAIARAQLAVSRRRRERAVGDDGDDDA